ncbi:MAG: hypothetical protein IT497_07125 [Ottowia sp.]|nr:hypothetical protein [Ottowia sp.]
MNFDCIPNKQSGGSVSRNGSSFWGAPPDRQLLEGNDENSAVLIKYAISNNQKKFSYLGGVFELTSKETDPFNRAAGIAPAQPGDAKTTFVGLAKVAQVLRWVSSATLVANRDQGEYLGGNTGNGYGSPQAGVQKNPRYTPEIQATILGGRLLLGSNARDDKHMPAALHALLNDSATYLEAVRSMQNKMQRTRSDEEVGLLNQQLRHLNSLRDFLHEGKKFRTPFIKLAVQECSKKEEKLLASSMLQDMADALGDVGKLEMAGKPQVNGKPVRGMVHAEQRIIEYVQVHQELEFTKTRGAAKRWGTSLPGGALPFIVAGTKPPCYSCNITEQTRNRMVISSGIDSTRLIMYRYEDRMRKTLRETYAVGKLYAANLAEFHPEVTKEIKSKVQTGPGPDGPNTSERMRRNSKELPLFLASGITSLEDQGSLPPNKVVDASMQVASVSDSVASVSGPTSRRAKFAALKNQNALTVSDNSLVASNDASQLGRLVVTSEVFLAAIAQKAQQEAQAIGPNQKPPEENWPSLTSSNTGNLGRVTHNASSHTSSHARSSAGSNIGQGAPISAASSSSHSVPYASNRSATASIERGSCLAIEGGK